jgi:putative membrane protein
MSLRTFKRNKLSTLLGLATAGLLMTTTSLYAQTAAGSSKAESQAGKNASGQMGKQNATGEASPAASDAGTSSSDSAQGASTSGASGTAGATGGSDPKSASGISGAAGKLSKSDQEMMQKIAQANIAEIETAKLAQEKSQNEEVRSFAKKMVDDHTKAQNELEQIAQSKSVSLPTKPDKKHQMAMKKLNNLSGAEFDKQYIRQAGESDHRDTHRLLERVSKQAKDEDLKQYATKTIASVDQHWDMVKDIKSGQSTAGGSGAGTAGSSDKAGGSSTKESAEGAGKSGSSTK